MGLLALAQTIPPCACLSICLPSHLIAVVHLKRAFIYAPGTFVLFLRFFPGSVLHPVPYMLSLLADGVLELVPVTRGERDRQRRERERDRQTRETRKERREGGGGRGGERGRS